VVTAGMPLALAGADDGVPSASALNRKVIAALGGDQKRGALHALHAHGTMEGVSGFPGSYEVTAKAPGSSLVTWDIGYIHQSTGIDPNQGWERVAAVRQLTGNELGQDQRDSRFNLLYTLLEEKAAFQVREGRCGNGPAYLLVFAGGDTFGVDRQSYLPACEKRTERYEEGPIEVETDFADYRAVEGLMLPFAIDEKRPDNVLKIKIDHYEVNPEIADSLFLNPERAHFGDPVQLRLATFPEHIYKEPEDRFTPGDRRYWGMYFYPSEGWTLDLMVKEVHGRYVEPEHAHADFFSGGQKMGSQDWEGGALLALRRYPIARFTPQGEIYGFRLNFNVPRSEKIDRINYSYQGKAADGKVYGASLEIPVTFYQQKTSLIFPMKGKFMVMSGHEYYENEHKYERSQQFGFDIVALGPNFEFATNDGATATDYVGWGRREIIAPAAGRVVYARNDIRDGAVKAAFLKLQHAKEAIAGNLVVIDHGNNEFSIFCHMHFGSVRVKTGDVVTAGEVLGLLGSAGSPGFPHLHYQLQAGPEIFGADGLPVDFTNIEPVGWIGGRNTEDGAGSAAVGQPRDGVFMQTR
jgi:murein DD-endopeptidase MepM/ murein hydrolase activator NlpD